MNIFLLQRESPRIMLNKALKISVVSIISDILIFKVFFLQRSTISETQKRSRNYCSKRLCKTLKFSSSRIRLNRMWTIIICNKLFDKRETETTGDIIHNTPIHKFVKSKNLKVKLICEKKLLTKCLGLIHLPLTGHVYI